MMKTNKFVCALLALLFSFSMFAACNKGNRKNSETLNVDSSGTNYTAEQLKTWVDVPEFADSDYYLVKNGKTDFVAVYPSNSTSYEKTGVKELVTFFKQATGIDLITYGDADYIRTADSKFISIGSTTLLEDTDIDLSSYVLGSSGYIIKTLGGNVYLAGSGRFGSLYAVYEFLSYEFGYEFYSPDEIAIEENVTDKKLKNFGLVDIPAFDYRIGGNGEIGDWLTRSRMCSLTDVYAGTWEAGGIPPFHNYFEFISYEKYGDHTDWFSPDGSSLCLSRDFDGLLEAVTYEVIEFLKKYPQHEVVSFTQEDGGRWCSHCIEEYTRLTGDAEIGGNYCIPSAANETDSGRGARQYYTLQAIRFVNELAKRIKAWNEEACPERNIGVYLFRYGPTTDIPVKTDKDGNPVFDENGNYIFFDENMEIADNLGVIYCYSFQSTYNDIQHSGYYDLEEDFKKWNTITDEMALWGYITNFEDYFSPFDALQQIEANVDLCRKSHARVFYIMSQFNITTPVDWGFLESYVTRKLAWNPDLDVARLMNDFFDNYFKQAAPIMKEIYRDYTTHLAWISSENKVNSKVNGQAAMNTTENWSYDTLKTFLAQFEEAYATISQLQYTDPALYKKLYDRINIESMTFRYLLLKLYPEKFDYSELSELRSQVIKECVSLGINLSKEHGDISGLF